jgi:CHASE2 domain-containing sensor protein
MTSRFSWLGSLLPGAHRRTTGVLIILACLFMLSGLASKIMNTHDTFAKTDSLAAISLLLSGVPEDVQPVTLLDVDDATRKAWNSRGATPHAALAELARISAEKGAKAILVDFDLTTDAPGTPADPALLNLLKSYPPEAPLLMLVRKIGFSRPVSGDADLLAAAAAPSPYDLAASGKPNVIWVTTLNDIDSDRSVRRIRLWQTVCDGARGTALPSAALMTAATLGGHGSHRDSLPKFLEARVEIECGATDAALPGWPPVRAQAAYLPYVLIDDPGGPAQLRVTAGGKPTVALRRISAMRLVDYSDGQAKAAGEIDSDPFADRVAVIGASYTESTDVYETPLGTMPGSMILANSIVQAKTLTDTVPPSPMLRNVMALGLFIIFALISRYLVGVLTLVSVGLSAVLALIIVSRAFGYETGLGVAGAALTGFALFKLLDALAQIVRDYPKRGWRAILKP